MTTEGRPKPTQESPQLKSSDSYIPLDPDEELKKILARRTEIHEHKGTTESISEERAALSEQARNLERDTLEQRLAIAKLINHAHELINLNPNLTPDELITQLQPDIIKARLAPIHLYTLRKGFTEYQNKHEAIKAAIEKYQTPKALYAACFGKAPVGKVEWEITSMAIHFHCFVDDDFQHALFLNDSTVQSRYRESKKQSLAVAVVVQNLPELNGCITAINLSNNLETKTAREDVEHEVKGVCDLTKGSVKRTIKCENQTYELVTHYEESTPPAGMFFIAVRNISNGQSTRMMSFEQKTNPVTSEIYWIDYNGQKYTNRFVQTPLSADGLAFIVGDLVTGNVQIVNHTDQPVYYLQKESVVRTDIRDPKRVTTSQTHEEQHLWNIIFAPKEPVEKWDELTNRYAHNPEQTPELAKEYFRNLYINSRKYTGIDTAARDEIIACYASNRTPEQIASLMNQKAYDYKSHSYYSSKFTEISQFLNSHISYFMKYVPPDSVIRGNSQIEQDMALEYAYNEDYNQTITEWTDAIKKMEASGLPRETILAILYQEPASHWEVTARRYAKFTKQEEAIPKMHS